MSNLEQYMEQLNEIETKFNDYKQDLDNIICRVSSSVSHTVITKEEITNPTPYYQGQTGYKLNGEIYHLRSFLMTV